ncbi:hypothetical protein, partial [uncultured Eudoraea sp.]|uniref:hypothetical protein n=1 Tax=uncultured Eudoraea sp. TaxID=1035614 RepID=UPI0026063F49
MITCFIFALLFAIGCIGLYANEVHFIAPQEVQVGDIFKIGDPDAPRYRHINFPRPNFIIKKGGVANYNRLEGNKVVVTAVKEKKDGTLEVMIKRTDGVRFFGSHREVSADLKA